MSGSSDPLAAVLARLQTIAGELAVTDGVSRFNHLYLEVRNPSTRALRPRPSRIPDF
jgi:hypothetical protein